MLSKVILFTSEQHDDTVDFSSRMKDVMKKDGYKTIEYEEINIEDDKAEPFLQNFFVTRVPTTVLLDETGEVIRKIIGIVPEKDMRKFIDYDLEETNKF